MLNSLSGFRLHFPGKKVLEVRSDETKAVVIDRGSFDRLCADRAAKAGSEILTGHTFIGMMRKDGKVFADVSTKEGKKTIQTSLLIGADGYKSNVSRSAGLEKL